MSNSSRVLYIGRGTNTFGSYSTLHFCSGCTVFALHNNGLVFGESAAFIFDSIFQNLEALFVQVIWIQM